MFKKVELLVAAPTYHATRIVRNHDALSMDIWKKGLNEL